MIFQILSKKDMSVIAEIEAKDFKTGYEGASNTYPGLMSGLRVCSEGFPPARIPIQAGLFS